MHAVKGDLVVCRSFLLNMLLRSVIEFLFLLVNQVLIIIILLVCQVNGQTIEFDTALNDTIYINVSAILYVTGPVKIDHLSKKNSDF